MIAFLINELDIRGGTHKQFLKLLDYTSSKGVDFFVVTKNIDLDKTYPGFEKYKDKIRLFDAPRKCNLIAKIFSFNKNIRKLKNLIQDADVVNIHDSGFELYLSAFRNKKVVWQINDLPSSFNVGAVKRKQISLKDIVRQKLVKSNLSFVEKIVVNVSKNRERVQQCLKRDALVFYCGIEPVDIHRELSNTFERFEKKKINLLSSGVFFTYRNYETQLLVVQKLRMNGVDVKLNIIGSTELDKGYADKIRSQIDDYKLNEYVRICGQVDDTMFRRLHEDADIFLFVNIDQSWGLAVFEAMSCGLPVIVSRSVGATEILADGKNSFFVNPTDVNEIVGKINLLMQDKSVYSNISEAAMILPSEYTWEDAYCSKMLNLLIS